MTSEEKRNLIYNMLKAELEKSPPTISAGSAKGVRRAKLFYIKGTVDAPQQEIPPATSYEEPVPEPTFPANLFSELVPDNISASKTVEPSSIPEVNIPKPSSKVVSEINLAETSAEAPKEEPLVQQPQYKEQQIAVPTQPQNTSQNDSVKIDKTIESDSNETSRTFGNYREDGYYDEDGKFIHVDDMTNKEYKQFLKDKKKEDKFYDRVRKDIHKRGYDTTVLEHFEEIEEVYDLSNEEIDQIRAAGFINQDSFYSFIPPSDYREIKRESLATKKVVLICGALLVCVVIVLYSFRSLAQLF